jgi:hypothetical protein
MRNVILEMAILLALGAHGMAAQIPDPPSTPHITAAPQKHAGMDMPEMKHDNGSMAGTDGGWTQQSPALVDDMEERNVPHWSDTEWSIFNHRGAGWFLLLWGLTALIAGLQWPRRSWWRFAPAFTLFALVEFLFFRNDPEAWPIGPVGLWASLKDPEVFQHRIFLLLLLAMAITELLRAAGRLSPVLQQYSLPALATFGGIYLFFHKHGGPAMAKMMAQMNNPSIPSSPAMQSMMNSMSLVRHEHLWFSLIGFGLAAARLLVDTGRLKGRFGASLWPVFAIILGIYMAGYSE